MNEEWVERCMQLAHDWAMATYYKAQGRQFADIDNIRKKLKRELRKVVQQPKETK